MQKLEICQNNIRDKWLKTTPKKQLPAFKIGGVRRFSKSVKNLIFFNLGQKLKNFPLRKGS